jgi:hypothetical protein
MEGAKVYIQDASATWLRATVLAALGSGRFRVQKDLWEDEAESRQAEVETLEVDASKMEGGMLPFPECEYA